MTQAAGLSAKVRMPSEAQAAALEAAGIARGSYRFEPLTPLRRAIAARTAESAREVPHFPIVMDVDVDAALALRQALNAEGETRISLNDLVVRACALALARTPEANVSYTPEGLVCHAHADIAVAVAVEGGLLTPIVRSAEAKSVREISDEIAELARRARTRRLLPDEYTGGTFTVSNLGMFGVRAFGSILNPPQACILSVAAAEPRLAPRDGAVVTVTQMTVTLTCDHRAVDGATGARLLQAFRELMEAPQALAG
ncbi:2-oxo acid dehydrogenase subunit E2 [Phenylobacterium sp.]|uniref:2-oxo acid dehydrogenase subunit E2 n=1 Tax=Phenylobacterium sp. TaxID=1871053 RepID=UPI002DEE4C76|nr:2-oxo acid dehydrogenase subunit E2 [Phenylobacterium sp.]